LPRDLSTTTDGVEAHLEDAAHELRLIVTIAPDAVDELCAALGRLSDELNEIAHDLGLDQPLSRQLLDLRTRTDSFLLAASALHEAQPQSARVVALLRRAVDQTLADLAPLVAGVVAASATTALHS
jgi:hypothetical protein